MKEEKVDILLLGAGGREHALLAKLAESPRAGRLYVAPGNGGMAALAEVARTSDGTTLNADDPAAVASWVTGHGIGLVVIGPEAPLVAGVADAVRAAHIPCFGPGAAAARMEGSKRFAKEVMERANVATARYRAFTDRASCEAYVREVGAPVVVKADGLAAGKGVIVASTLEEALGGVAACFDGAFGAAGATVVIEERLEGPECSLLALTDGTTVVPLVTSQDHKRAYDGDRGPNTGGMGVYSPVPAVGSVEYLEMAAAMERVVATLRAEGITYSGCLYGGFMLTTDGPKVLEFNARFGDPETQAVLPRMRADLVSVMLACDEGTLSDTMIGWVSDVAVSVVVASAGYPGTYETGKPITGIADAEGLAGVTVYHAGTAIDDAGRLVSSGGRVLDVTAVAPTFEEARERAYAACDLIDFDGKTYRRDIAVRALDNVDFDL